MTPVPAPDIVDATNRVRRVVSAVLRIDADGLDPHLPLTAYGLDSLASMELVAQLEEEFETTLPDWLLTDAPDVDALSTLLGSGQPMPGLSNADRMRADSRLSDEIQPALGTPLDPPRAILMTGATGFLGGYLLCELLSSSNAAVHCLVREGGKTGLGRIERTLTHFGLWNPTFASRIVVVDGDLSRPGLGLRLADAAELAATIDAIYHVGAVVDWTQSYASLADVNVGATRELIRLACAERPKVLHFVSSLSVCYAEEGPAVVSETTDMQLFADRLPLGYAQTKTVAESLVKEAADRGLHTHIWRPTLIAGDSRSGASKVDDLIAALVKGCIEMGAAPDLDWMVDAVPVDHVARAVAALPRAAERGAAFHVVNHRPRHWRECVLWINLFGYRCALLPYDQWLARLERESLASSHPLHRLRSFFMRRLPGGATAPELYESNRRSGMDSSRSRARELLAGLACPRLDAHLLHRYFQDYIAQGFLPEPAAGGWSPGRDSSRPAIHSDIERFTPLLRAYLEDDSLRVSGSDLIHSGSAHSIIGELSGWRRGHQTGLFESRLIVEQRGVPRQLSVMIKSKPSDCDVIEVSETVAMMCGDRLGQMMRTFREDVGLRNSHIREPAIYQRAPARARCFMPVCYGTWSDEPAGTYGLLLERLENMALIDSVDHPESWSSDHLDAAMRGLGSLHASWMVEAQALERQPWMTTAFSGTRFESMRPLWQALADHAAPRFAAWAGDSIADTHQALVDSIGDWWIGIDRSPRTLIHNDCNPRNLALRHDGSGYRLCAYDWELATIGPPQRDVAELLTFVLSEKATHEDLHRASETYRDAFAAEGGPRMAREDWRDGLRAALAELLVNRLAFYAMIHRVRPQSFLPRVVRTWVRLFDLVAPS